MKLSHLDQEKGKDVTYLHSCSTLFWESSITQSRQEKEVRDLLVGKKEVKLCSFSDNTVVYVELMCKYSEVAGYEVNT